LSSNWKIDLLFIPFCLSPFSLLLFLLFVCVDFFFPLEASSPLKHNKMQSDLVQNGSVYDIEKELQDFDESKSGVKGLVDAGIIKTPPFFVVPESEVSC